MFGTMIRRTFKYRFNLNQFSNKNVYWACDVYREPKYVTEENFRFCHDIKVIDKSTKFFTRRNKFKKESIKHTWRRLISGDEQNSVLFRFIIHTFPNLPEMDYFKKQLSELTLFNRWLNSEKAHRANIGWGYSKAAQKFQDYYRTYIDTKKITKTFREEQKEASELRKKRARKTKACIRHS